MKPKNAVLLRGFLLIVLMLVGLSVLESAGAQTLSRTVLLVSRNSAGKQGNFPSYGAAVSGNGRYVAFVSVADNLVVPDKGDWDDVFVHDLQTRKTTMVSVNSAGKQGDYGGYMPALSTDGRYIVFTSVATNLVTNDKNFAEDVFLYDQQTKKTSRVSVRSNGLESNGDSYNVSISGDGQLVVFTSEATNLISGDTNNKKDIYVHNRANNTTARVSVAVNGQPNGDSDQASISADGRYVAFRSSASNLVNGDTNNKADIFIRDLQSGTTTRVSVGPNNVQGDNNSYNPSISGDGRVVAFESMASNLVPGDTNKTFDVFVRDLNTQQTSRVSVGNNNTQGNDYSFDPAVSADGRYVVFESEATNLVTGDTNKNSDVFVHDRQLNQTTRVSVSSTGVQGNSYSSAPAISADGQVIAFGSYANKLVSDDKNGEEDIFVSLAKSATPAPKPTITSLKPTSGGVGTTVTITGKNFDGASVVLFNRTPAITFQVISATRIQAVVPVGATTGKVSITTAGGTAISKGNFTVKAAKPVISSFSPTSGKIGDTIIIKGKNLNGTTNVLFTNNKSASFTILSDNQISVKVPAGAVTGKVSLTTSSGKVTSTRNFVVKK